MILCIILLNEADWMLMINGTPSWSFSSQVPNPEYFQGKCWIVYSSAVWELESFCLHPRTRIRVEFVHTLFRVFFFSHLPQSFRRMVWWRSGFFFSFSGKLLMFVWLEWRPLFITLTIFTHSFRRDPLSLLLILCIVVGCAAITRKPARDHSLVLVVVPWRCENSG